MPEKTAREAAEEALAKVEIRESIQGFYAGYQAGVEKGRAEVFEEVRTVTQRYPSEMARLIEKEIRALAGACDRPPGGGEG